MRKLLICADEVLNRDNFVESSSRLKAMITDDPIFLNAKHVRQHQVANRMSWIFSSNATTPVRVDGQHDRRYTIFSQPRPPAPEYTQMLKGLYGADNEFTPAFEGEVAAFAHALIAYPVNVDQVRRPYEKAARREMALASQSSSRAFITAIEEDGVDEVIGEWVRAEAPGCQWDHGAEGVDAQALYKSYVFFCDANGYSGAVSNNAFGKELRLAHPDWVRGRLPKALPGGVRPRLVVGLPRSIRGDRDGK